MKLHLANPKNRNICTGYGAGYIAVNGTQHHDPLLVMPEQLVTRWPVSTVDALTAAAMDALLELHPEVIILGTGPAQRFPHPSLFGALSAAHIGLEIMSTPAACRTYNILMNEERRVLAAMFPP